MLAVMTAGSRARRPVAGHASDMRATRQARVLAAGGLAPDTRHPKGAEGGAVHPLVWRMRHSPHSWLRPGGPRGLCSHVRDRGVCVIVTRSWKQWRQRRELQRVRLRGPLLLAVAPVLLRALALLVWLRLTGLPRLLLTSGPPCASARGWLCGAGGWRCGATGWPCGAGGWRCGATGWPCGASGWPCGGR